MSAAPIVGQVWADNDPRSEGRTLRVESVSECYVRLRVLTDRDGCLRSSVGMLVAVSRHRLKPNRSGYRLVEDNK